MASPTAKGRKSTAVLAMPQGDAPSPEEFIHNFHETVRLAMKALTAHYDGWDPSVEERVMREAQLDINSRSYGEGGSSSSSGKSSGGGSSSRSGSSRPSPGSSVANSRTHSRAATPELNASLPRSNHGATLLAPMQHQQRQQRRRQERKERRRMRRRAARRLTKLKAEVGKNFADLYWSPAEVHDDIDHHIHELRINDIKDLFSEMKTALDATCSSTAATLGKLEDAEDALDQSGFTSAITQQQISKVEETCKRWGVMSVNMEKLRVKMVQCLTAAFAEHKRVTRLLEAEEAKSATAEHLKDRDDLKDEVRVLTATLMALQRVNDTPTEGHDSPQMTALQSTISEKEAQLAEITKEFERLSLQFKVYEGAAKYMDSGNSSLMPDELVLEVVDDIKGRLREQIIPPMLRQLEEDDATAADDLAQVQLLEDERERLTEELTQVRAARTAWPITDTALKMRRTRLIVQPAVDEFESPPQQLPQARSYFLRQFTDNRERAAKLAEHTPKFMKLLANAQASLDEMSTVRENLVKLVKKDRERFLADAGALGKIHETVETFEAARQITAAWDMQEDWFMQEVQELDERRAFAKAMFDEERQQMLDLQAACESAMAVDARQMIRVMLSDEQRQANVFGKYMDLHKRESDIVAALAEQRRSRYKVRLADRMQRAGAKAEGAKDRRRSERKQPEGFEDVLDVSGEARPKLVTVVARRPSRHVTITTKSGASVASEATDTDAGATPGGKGKKKKIGRGRGRKRTGTMDKVKPVAAAAAVDNDARGTLDSRSSYNSQQEGRRSLRKNGSSIGNLLQRTFSRSSSRSSAFPEADDDRVSLTRSASGASLPQPRASRGSCASDFGGSYASGLRHSINSVTGPAEFGRRTSYDDFENLYKAKRVSVDGFETVVENTFRTLHARNLKVQEAVKKLEQLNKGLADVIGGFPLYDNNGGAAVAGDDEATQKFREHLAASVALLADQRSSWSMSRGVAIGSEAPQSTAQAVAAAGAHAAQPDDADRRGYEETKNRIREMLLAGRRGSAPTR